LWEYINRSQKQECRNWDYNGRAVPFLGIFVSKVWYFVFAVQAAPLAFGSEANQAKSKLLLFLKRGFCACVLVTLKQNSKKLKSNKNEAK
jgi:hypothetical protein